MRSERIILAFGLTFAVVVGIGVLSGIAIGTSNKDDTSLTVFNTVLPLFGTWVGTVLAFYFARENFAAASASQQKIVENLTAEAPSSTSVQNAMSKVVYKEDVSAKVEDVKNNLIAQNINRVVIERAGSYEALLFKDGLLEYLNQNPANASKTLGDVVNERPDLKQTPAFVAGDATLAQAKTEMEKIPNCKVILVTTSGRPGDPITGIMTNTDISKYSKAS